MIQTFVLYILYRLSVYKPNHVAESKGLTYNLYDEKTNQYLFFFFFDGAEWAYSIFNIL